MRRGAAGIKVVASGGVLSPAVALDESPFSVDELRSAVEIATAAQKWTAAHAVGLEGTKRAVRAGVTTIEHGIHLDSEVVEMMASRQTILVATRIALVQILANARHLDPAVTAKATAVYERNVESTQLAYKAGVRIAAGSDAGTPFNPHGNVAREAQLLVDDIGMPTELAILAITETAAACLGRPDLGRIAVNGPAHLLVTPGNPLDDITVLQGPARVVMLRGSPLTWSPWTS